jgi:hypothetical protein
MSKIKLIPVHVKIYAPFDNTNDNWVLVFIFFREIFSPKLLFKIFCEMYVRNLILVDVTFYYAIVDGVRKRAGVNFALYYENDPLDNDPQPTGKPIDPNNPDSGKTYYCRAVTGLLPKFQSQGLSMPMHKKFMDFYKSHNSASIYIRAIIISPIEFMILVKSISRIYPAPGCSIPMEFFIELRKFIAEHGGEVSPLQPCAVKVGNMRVYIQPEQIDGIIKRKKAGDINFNFYCQQACPLSRICSRENCAHRDFGLAVIIPLNKKNIRETAFKLLISQLSKFVHIRKRKH